MKVMKRLTALFLSVAMVLTVFVVPVAANSGIAIRVMQVGGGAIAGGNQRVQVGVYLEGNVTNIGSISFLHINLGPHLTWDLDGAYNPAQSATWPFAPGAASTDTSLTLIAPHALQANGATFSFDSVANATAGGRLLTLDLISTTGAPETATVTPTFAVPQPAGSRGAAGVHRFDNSAQVTPVALHAGSIGRSPNVIITGTLEGGSVTSYHTRGSQVTLLPGVHSALNQRFVNWTGSGIAGLPSTANPLTFTMPATGNVTLAANFGLDPAARTVTLVNAGAGAVSPATTVSPGRTVTIEPGTRPDAVFAGWSASPAVAIVNNTFVMPASDITLTAQWAEPPPTPFVVSPAAPSNERQDLVIRICSSDIPVGAAIMNVSVGWDDMPAASEFTEATGVFGATRWNVPNESITIPPTASNISINAPIPAFINQAHRDSIGSIWANPSAPAAPSMGVVLVGGVWGRPLPAAPWWIDDPDFTPVTLPPTPVEFTMTFSNVLITDPGARVYLSFTGRTATPLDAPNANHIIPVFPQAADPGPHTVTVTGGGTGVTGSGDFMTDDIVEVFAGTRPGYFFNYWYVTGGAMLNPSWNSPHISFAMPGNSVTLEARWHQAELWPGNVNNDMFIDAEDVAMLEAFLRSANRNAFARANYRFRLDNADVNQDGTVDRTDLTLLRRYLAVRGN